MTKQSRYLAAYAQWAGNPQGVKPKFDQCSETVYRDHIGYQCSRKCGHGPDGAFCKQHAKRFEAKTEQEQ